MIVLGFLLMLLYLGIGLAMLADLDAAREAAERAQAGACPAQRAKGTRASVTP